jgi:thiol-disulfide isomerase/thioredoxin
MRPLIRLLLLVAVCAAPAAGVTFEEAIADPKLWPAEVTVLGATRATVLKDGKPAGILLVGSGRKLAVTAVSAEGVTGKLGGDTVRVPADKTNLYELLNLNRPSPPGEGSIFDVEAKPPTLRGAVAEKNAILSDLTGEAVPAPLTPMQRQLDGKLVRLADGKLGPISVGQALAGVKFYAIYFSAAWCGPCRQFTPGFVSAYKELKQKYPNFEVIFVSNDRSATEMANYMRQDRMPWPALQFEHVQSSQLTRYAGPGIPCLVLVDPNGKVLAHSFRGSDYLGPQHVLDEARRLLALNLGR